MPEPARLCLHVGLAKAGSTTLQQGVFRRLDTVSHALERKGGPYDEQSSTFGQLVRGAREGNLLDFDKAGFARDFAASRRAAPDRPHLVSEERFSWYRGYSFLEKPTLLRELFGPAEILIVIRRPSALLRSLYDQELKYRRYGLDTSKSFPVWVDRALQNSDHHLSPANMLRFDTIAEAFAEVFGRAHVHVVPLEWLRENPQRFADALAGCLGVDGGALAPLLAAPPRNMRPLTPNAFAAARAVKRGLLLQYIQRSRAMMGRHTALLQRIDRFAAPHMDRLSRQWELPLEQLGYDCDRSRAA